MAADLKDLFNEPTPAERTAQILRDECEGLKNHARASYENILRMVWCNPWGLSPQDVFDVLGKRGAALLKAREIFGAMLAEACPDNPPADLRPEKCEITVAEDGSVKVK